MATTLPEIGRTHSKGFCSTVRDNVAPSLLGLMKTDELIGASHRALLKMARFAAEALDSSPTAVRARPSLRRQSRARRWRTISSSSRSCSPTRSVFRRKPATDDDRFALLLKAQLQAAADRQNLALNHVNGDPGAQGDGPDAQRASRRRCKARSGCRTSMKSTEPGADAVPRRLVAAGLGRRRTCSGTERRWRRRLATRSGTSSRPTSRCSKRGSRRRSRRSRRRWSQQRRLPRRHRRPITRAERRALAHSLDQ